MEKTLDIQDLFIEIEDNKVLTRAGDYIMAYKIAYPPKYTQSREQIKSAQSLWDRALRSLPIGALVCKSDIYQKPKYDSSDMRGSHFIDKYTAIHFAGREYISQQGYVFFVWPHNIKITKQIKNPFVFPSGEIFKDADKHTSMFQLQVQECIQTLAKSDSQFTVQPLNNTEIVQYVYQWFNGLETDGSSDIVFNDHSVHIGQKIGRMLAITSETAFPEELETAVKDENYSQETAGFIFYRGLLDNLGITLHCEHILNQIIQITDTKRVIQDLYATQKKLSGAIKFGHQNVVGFERTSTYLEELKKEEYSDLKFVLGHTNIITFCDDIETSDLYFGKITQALQDNNIGYYKPTGRRLQNLFLNTNCINISNLDYKSFYLVGSNVATSLLVNSGEYEDDIDGIYFQDRLFNKPNKFDFWDAPKKRLESRNYTIFAPTGRGKSVLANAILTGLINRQECVCVVIDYGGSYEKLAALYDKSEVSYFKYVPGLPLGLNPFFLEENEKPNELKIESICDMVWTMIKKTDKPSENEKTSLREIVQSYFSAMIQTSRIKDVCWRTFYDFVTKNKELLAILEIDAAYFNVKDFAHGGRDFIDGGIYSNVFESSENLSQMDYKNKKLIIFELDKIDNNILLLNIMLMVIAATISKVIWSDKKTRGVVHFDEFARTLKLPGIMDRVEFYAQAIRKQSGMLGLVLQNAYQFPNSDIGNALLANMQTTIALPTDEIEVIKSLQERKSFNEHDVTQIRSMKHDFNGERKYSEFFLKRGGQFAQVYRLELAPEALAAFQTEGEETAKIMEEYAKIGNMEQVILEYISLKTTLK